MNGINLTLPDGSRVSLDDPALTDLFPVWHDQDGITFVETGKQVTDFAQRGQDLSDSGRLGQPYHFDPITPDFTISGDARIDRKGRMSITIELRDRCSGQIIARITIARRLRGGPHRPRFVARAPADELTIPSWHCARAARSPRLMLLSPKQSRLGCLAGRRKRWSAGCARCQLAGSNRRTRCPDQSSCS